MTAAPRWRCHRYLCDEPAAGFVEPPNGPGIWYGCTTHLPAMATALSTGFGGSDEATVTMLHQPGGE